MNWALPRLANRILNISRQWKTLGYQKKANTKGSSMQLLQSLIRKLTHSSITATTNSRAFTKKVYYPNTPKTSNAMWEKGGGGRKTLGQVSKLEIEKPYISDQPQNPCPYSRRSITERPLVNRNTQGRILPLKLERTDCSHPKRAFSILLC